MQHLEITSDASHDGEKRVLRRGFPGAKKAARTETYTDQLLGHQNVRLEFHFAPQKRKRALEISSCVAV